jgi:MFS family permease
VAEPGLPAGPSASAAVPATGGSTQRRTVAVLSAAQVIGGIGVGASVSVGALLAEDLSGSAAWSGMAATLTTLGAAAAAVPLAWLADRSGRRVALSTGWALAGCGAGVAVAAALVGSFPVFLVALLLMGAGNAATLQSRFAATDLAPASSRGRALGLVVWATTVGAVAGPNLTRPGAAVADAVGIPLLSGPFVFSAVAAVLAVVVLAVALRPDPLLTARRLKARQLTRSEPVNDAASAVTQPSAAPRAVATIRASPQASAAIASIVTAHAVMVAVMAMTPVHMNGHGAGLTVIGLTISLHIAGMYALSPIVGWFADRRGRTPTVLAGLALLLVATGVTATAAQSTARITLGLILLGLGWSFTTVAASTQLADAVPVAERPRVQGTSDLLMNLAGATAGALSGGLVTTIGYAGLSLAAAVAVIPAAITVVAYRRSPAGRQPATA